MIGLQVCFHSAMKHENDVSNVVDCLQVVRIYRFKKKIKVQTCASYTVFLFVKSENNIIKEIKHVLFYSSLYYQNTINKIDILEERLCVQLLTGT